MFSFRSRPSSGGLQNKDSGQTQGPGVQGDSNAFLNSQLQSAPQEVSWLDQLSGGGNRAKLESAIRSAATGRPGEAKTLARALAQQLRESGESGSELELAGQVWQLADGLEKLQAAAKSNAHGDVKARASDVASLGRGLMAAGIGGESTQSIIDAAGNWWTAADEESKASPRESTPMIDQHGLDHERNWAYCGLATLAMTLGSHGQVVNLKTRGAIEQFKQGIYIQGKGSSGTGMADRMREYGHKDAQFTTQGGPAEATRMLDAGKSIPLGVLRLRGTVLNIPGGKSERYPGLKAGDSVKNDFPGSGHWVTLVGYEGKAENPSHFIVNDPDTGAQLKLTQQQMTQSAESNWWMIRY